MSAPQVVFGGYVAYPHFEDPAYLAEVFSLLLAHNVTTIDTAKIYGNSEELLGASSVGDKFTVDTKTVGGFAGPTSGGYDTVTTDARESKEKLRTNVDVFYLHSPAQVPLEDTLKGVKEVYESGFFKRFGISNFEPKDVEAVVEGCKKLGIPPPSVYQGNYNPFARNYETTLFPILRHHKISFYAYSPIAGGFLAKTKEQILAGAGRFDPSTMLGEMYSRLYSKPTLLGALERWGQIAEEEGVTRPELAYRWVRFNSALSGKNGDAIIIGARDKDQLKETLAWVEKGPLSEKAVKAIEAIWETIKDEAPTANTDK